MKQEYSAPHATGLSKGQIEEIAGMVAAKFSFGVRDSVELLVHRLGGRLVERLPTAGEDASLRVDGPGQFEISLSPLVGVERERFSIAHELGHYFLHSKCGQVQICAMRYGSTPVEWEANWFAAELLMPAEEFQAAHKRVGSDIDRLAAEFFVSHSAAKVRASALNL